MIASAISRNTRTCTTSISSHVQSTWHSGGMLSVDTRPRQQLELSLIGEVAITTLTLRASPNNQENKGQVGSAVWEVRGSDRSGSRE